MERLNRLGLHLTWCDIEAIQKAESTRGMQRSGLVGTQDCSAETVERANETGVIKCAGTHAMPLEAWAVGQSLVTKCRTVNDSDIVGYVQMTGYSAENLFGDMEYLRRAGHDKRMAPGLLTASIADALIVGSGILEGYAIALVNITDMVAKAPVYGGDTLQVKLQVTNVKLSKSKPDRGVVTTRQQVINQSGQVVMEYTVSRMLKRSTGSN